LIDAGASFIVSPVLDEGVLAAAARCAIPAIPGALTPNEILQAHRAGAAAVKVFPIGSVGGVAYIRSINEPFTDIPLVVSGGIQIADVSAYLAAGCRAVCLGGALIDRAAAKAGDIGTVTAYARAILATS
jgi:2-dehydro-3-deoxyphosphogluconate aldolase/(4S)-4-hydroxy-2-oxoglutarate aldolase